VKEGSSEVSVEVRCACGSTFKRDHQARAAPRNLLGLPFFTGRQKLIDTEGRVERFTKKFGAQTAEQRKTAAKAAKATKAKTTGATKRTRKTTATA
jgi:large subunit ribosomal protein L31